MKRPIVNVILTAFLSIGLVVGMMPGQAKAAYTLSVWYELGPDDWSVGEGPMFWVWEGAGEKVITVKSMQPPADFVGTVDYEAQINGEIVSGTLTFTTDNYSFDIPVPVVDDSVPEMTEQGYIKLFNYSDNIYYPDEDQYRIAPIYIMDDEAPVLVNAQADNSAPVELEEGQSRQFELQRRGNLLVPLEAEVSYASAEAVPGEDFLTANDTIELPAIVPDEGYDVTSGVDWNIYVPAATIDDSQVEQNESFTVTVNSISDGTIIHSESQTYTITDNDVAPPTPTVAFSDSSYTVQENGGFADVELVRTGDLAEPVYVEICACSETAKAGQDYDRVSGWFAFAPGQDRLIVPVAIREDSKKEGTETFRLKIMNVSGAEIEGATKATVLIIDND